MVIFIQVADCVFEQLEFLQKAGILEHMAHLDIRPLFRYGFCLSPSLLLAEPGRLFRVPNQISEYSIQLVTLSDAVVSKAAFIDKQVSHVFLDNGWACAGCASELDATTRDWMRYIWIVTGFLYCLTALCIFYRRFSSKAHD